ncbi:YecA family protein [Cellulosilyticum sp. I15G10I2]|uniref:YecA family protein n=1 Tax=Cellulosilyticum sp. I15G10I2 TaxID=1892843 RepID=UPI00085CCEC8|nr:SEC-C metal-binding domain-containing protein [Cellulosilyticum sp. I15G10I2]
MVNNRDYYYFNQTSTYGMDFQGIIDEQYLIYSALFRVYSCYDKISKILLEERVVLNLENVKYFEDLRSVKGTNKLLLRIQDIIKNDKDYRMLYIYRNDIYHNLRMGCLNGKEGTDYYNAVLLQVIFKNIKIIQGILQEIITSKSIKIGRNDICFCGSKKKYKLCCGKS